MKNNKYFLNTLLAAVLFAVLAAMVLARALFPAIVLPAVNIPNIILICAATLLAEHLIAPHSPRCFICVAVFGIVTFALLPLMAGFACVHNFWKIGLVGGAAFTACTFLFDSITDRLATGSKAAGAAAVCALGLWLAGQCFAGMIL